MKNSIGVIGLCVVLVIITIAFGIITYRQENYTYKLKNDCIKKGYASYVIVDSLSGETEFRLK
jgi:hypothetical protein